MEHDDFPKLSNPVPYYKMLCSDLDINNKPLDSLIHYFIQMSPVFYIISTLYNMPPPTQIHVVVFGFEKQLVTKPAATVVC